MATAQIPQPMPCKKRARITPEICEQVRKLHDLGISKDKIAFELCISSSSAHKIARKLGLPAQPYRPRQRATTPETVSNVFMVKINASLVRSLIECASAAKLSIEELGSEAIERHVIEFRSLRIPPTILASSTESVPVIVPESRRSKIDGPMAQKILFLLDQEVPPNVVAKRFRISKTSVRRIVEMYEARETRVRPAPRPTRGQRWDDGQGFTSGHASQK